MIFMCTLSREGIEELTPRLAKLISSIDTSSPNVAIGIKEYLDKVFDTVHLDALVSLNIFITATDLLKP